VGQSIFKIPPLWHTQDEDFIVRIEMYAREFISGNERMKEREEVGKEEGKERRGSRSFRVSEAEYILKFSIDLY